MASACRSTRPEIIDKLNREINAILAVPKAKARLTDLGGTVIAGSPLTFESSSPTKTEKWGKVVKFSGAKPDN